MSSSKPGIFLHKIVFWVVSIILLFQFFISFLVVFEFSYVSWFRLPEWVELAFYYSDRYFTHVFFHFFPQVAFVSFFMMTGVDLYLYLTQQKKCIKQRHFTLSLTLKNLMPYMVSIAFIGSFNIILYRAHIYTVDEYLIRSLEYEIPHNIYFYDMSQVFLFLFFIQMLINVGFFYLIYPAIRFYAKRRSNVFYPKKTIY